MRGVEMVTLMADQGRLLDDAGADGTGAHVLFVPVGTEIEPGLFEFAIPGVVADVIDGDPSRVGQQQDVTERRHALEELLHTTPGNTQKTLDLLLMLAQAGILDDTGRLGARRIQPVIVDAARPRSADHSIC